MAVRARTSPRKSPRQERARETVETILQATTRILVRDGYDKLSTNRVALAAGVSIGSLYQYFPSKEALVVALIDRHREQTSAKLMALMLDAQSLPLEQAARTIVRGLIEVHRIEPKLHKVLIEQVPRVGRMREVEAVEKQLGEVLRAYLVQNARDVRPGDPDVAVFVLVHAVEAITHAAVIDEGAKLLDRDDLVDEVTELVVRYLRK